MASLVENWLPAMVPILSILSACLFDSCLKISPVKSNLQQSVQYEDLKKAHMETLWGSKNQDDLWIQIATPRRVFTRRSTFAKVILIDSVLLVFATWKLLDWMDDFRSKGIDDMNARFDLTPHQNNQHLQCNSQAMSAKIEAKWANKIVGALHVKRLSFRVSY